MKGVLEHLGNMGAEDVVEMNRPRRRSKGREPNQQPAPHEPAFPSLALASRPCLQAVEAQLKEARAAQLDRRVVPLVAQGL